MAAYISRTLASNGEYKLTISMWVKLAKIQEQDLVTSYSSGSLWASLRFASNGRLSFQDYRSGYLLNMKTNAEYKDTNAWYHIVANYDASLATPTAKLYVNGEEPSLQTNTIYSQNPTTSWGSAYTFRIGEGSSLGGNDFEGVMSDVYFIQGYTYDASTFGETDSTTGEWKPILNPTINYGGTGGNSCHLKFENSANMDLDSGDNNLTFTTSGTLTQTEDNPSNNFATLNTLDTPFPGQVATFSNGATTGAGTETGFLAGASSIGVSSGKYYAEFKVTGGNTSFHVFGVLKSPVDSLGSTAPHDSTRFYGVRGTGNKIEPGGGGGETTGWAGSWTTNDIISLALDMDNNRLYVAKNGQYCDGSGNYNQAFTGSPAYITLASNEIYHLMGASISTGSGVSLTMQSNFGNGYFGTTAISSEGTNASGIGKFEYDVPTGYTALSTKGLNE